MPKLAWKNQSDICIGYDYFSDQIVYNFNFMHVYLFVLFVILND